MLTSFLWLSQKKGITLHTRADRKKNTCSLIFCTDAIYKFFQVPSSSGSLVLQPTKGVTDRRMDGHMDRRTDGQAQTNMPPQLLRGWGHKKK